MLGHAAAARYGDLFDNGLTGPALWVWSSGALRCESQRISEGESLKVAS